MRSALFLSLAVSLSCASLAEAQVEREDPPVEREDPPVERGDAVRVAEIFELVAAEGQGKPGAKAKLKGQLERLMKTLAKSQAQPQPALPVEFVPADVNIVDNHSTTTLSGKVVLADEGISITSARDCVLIARLSVQVTSATNCVIISGALVSVTSARDCTIISGARISANGCDGSVLAATDSIQLTTGKGSTAINPPAGSRLGFRGREARTVQVPELVLGRVAGAKHPLQKRVKVTEAVSRGDRGFALFQFDDSPGEYVARLNQKLIDPRGEAIKGLERWSMCLASRELVVFTDGKLQVLFWTGEPG